MITVANHLREEAPNPSIERQTQAGFAHLRLPLMSNVRLHEEQSDALDSLHATRQ
jgi:hypothetical protein